MTSAEKNSSNKNAVDPNLFTFSKKVESQKSEKKVQPNKNLYVGMRIQATVPHKDHLECPRNFSNLVSKRGDPWTNIPKMIHGMRKC